MILAYFMNEKRSFYNFFLKINYMFQLKSEYIDYDKSISNL